jgi:hypothetical protein
MRNTPNIDLGQPTHLRMNSNLLPFRLIERIDYKQGLEVGIAHAAIQSVESMQQGMTFGWFFVKKTDGKAR